MKKFMKIALPVVGTALVAAGTVAFMIAPGKAEKAQKRPFDGENIAHRGLHKADKTVPENSLAAFRAAVEAGYGVELDVHLTADGELVVFHDDTIKRMCGVDGRVEDMTLKQLRELSLLDTDQGIPTLDEVLSVIDGKVPIILEIKRGSQNDELCLRVYETIVNYEGDICIESFDPFIVRWWRKNAPEVLRGQLACTQEKFGDSTSPLNAFLVGNLLTNFLCRPQFIAYGICEKKPLLVRLCEKMGVMKVAWTSHGYASESDHDTVIFEYYRPRKNFK